MPLPDYVRHLLHTALLLLVLAGAGSIHSHVCFDGQEAPLTVHFENLSGHPDHHDDEIHVDVENKLLPQAVPGKPADQDAPLFMIAVLFLFITPKSQPQRYRTHRDLDFHHPPADLLPPLRAPPANSR
jgi:hypothetical protein